MRSRLRGVCEGQSSSVDDAIIAYKGHWHLKWLSHKPPASPECRDVRYNTQHAVIRPVTEAW